MFRQEFFSNSRSLAQKQQIFFRKTQDFMFINFKGEEDLVGSILKKYSMSDEEFE
jgi:hypothetical protein